MAAARPIRPATATLLPPAFGSDVVVVVVGAGWFVPVDTDVLVDAPPAPVVAAADAAQFVPLVQFTAVELEPPVVWLGWFGPAVALPPLLADAADEPLGPVLATCTEPLLVLVALVPGAIVTVPLGLTVSVEPALAAPAALPPAWAEPVWFGTTMPAGSGAVVPLVAELTLLLLAESTVGVDAAAAPVPLLAAAPAPPNRAATAAEAQLDTEVLTKKPASAPALPQPTPAPAPANPAITAEASVVLVAAVFTSANATPPVMPTAATVAIILTRNLFIDSPFPHPMLYKHGVNGGIALCTSTQSSPKTGAKRHE